MNEDKKPTPAEALEQARRNLAILEEAAEIRRRYVAEEEAKKHAADAIEKARRPKT